MSKLDDSAMWIAGSRFRLAAMASYGCAMFIICLVIGQSLHPGWGISLYAWVAGFTGLILGASRGLKAGPKEITFIASIPQIAFGTMAIIGSVSSLFFYSGRPGEQLTILNWSMLIISLVISICMSFILANLTASFFWNHLIRWKGLLFFNTSALLAAVVFCVEISIVNPSEAFPGVLMVLLPIGLPRWMIACWIRVEKELEKLEDASEKAGAQPLIESCDNV